MASGELGWLHTVRSTTLDPAPPPAAYVAVSGGIFRDCSVHDFDTIRWVTGREVVEVYATGANRGDELFAEAGDVDTAAAVLTLDDGTLAVVSNTRYNPRGHDVRLELHGSDGQHRRRPGGPPAAALGRARRHLPRRGALHCFFMDRFAAAYRAELDRLHRGRRAAGGPRRARSPTRWRPAGSPRPAPCPCSEHRPVRIDEVRMTTTAPRPDRRRPHLLGGVRGARLGLPARPRPGAGRDARGRPGRHRARARRVPARPTRRHGRVLADHGLQAVGGFVPLLLHVVSPRPGARGRRHARRLRRRRRGRPGAVRGHRRSTATTPARSSTTTAGRLLLDQPRPARRAGRRAAASGRCCTRTSAP